MARSAGTRRAVGQGDLAPCPPSRSPAAYARTGRPRDSARLQRAVSASRVGEGSSRDPGTGEAAGSAGTSEPPATGTSLSRSCRARGGRARTASGVPRRGFALASVRSMTDPCGKPRSRASVPGWGPCHPGAATCLPACLAREASARVHWRSPVPAIPLACGPGRNGDPWAFPGFTPGWAGPSRACPGGDRPQALAWSNAAAISDPLRRIHSLRATSRRNAPARCPLERVHGSGGSRLRCCLIPCSSPPRYRKLLYFIRTGTPARSPDGRPGGKTWPGHAAYFTPSIATVSCRGPRRVGFCR